MLRYAATALFLCLPAALLAQVNGSITGTVTDPSGSAIPAAAVKLTSESTGQALSNVSDADGNFVFTGVLPGIYSIAAEHQGFKRFQKQHIELTPGDRLSVGILQLSVGEVNESVTVQAEGATIQTASSERAGIVTSEEVKDLTVINRDFTSFAELQPGVVINVGVTV